MTDTLELLRVRHGLDWPEDKLQKLVSTCAEIIVMQEAIEEQEGHVQAYHDLFGDEDDEVREDGDEGQYCAQCGEQLFGFHSRPFCSRCD